MEFHLFEFRWRQFPGLVENVFRYCEFTHIMEQCSRLNGLDQFFICNADAFGQPHRVRLNAPNMPMGDLVLRVDRHCQRFDGRQVQSV